MSKKSDIEYVDINREEYQEPLIAVTCMWCNTLFEGNGKDFCTNACKKAFEEHKNKFKKK